LRTGRGDKDRPRTGGQQLQEITRIHLDPELSSVRFYDGLRSGR
jgi:hypothetical protein